MNSRFAILPILAFSAIAQPVTSPDFEAQFTAREMQWRNQVLPMIERRQGTHVDSEASQFVSALGTRLAHATPQPTVLQCRFVLYDDTVGLQVPGFGLLKRTHQVNALPGGIALVPLSLFDITADEAEFSSALARGIAHVALRHWMRTMVRSSFSSPWKPPFPKTLLFTRSFESEADRATVELLARTGLNPESDSRN